MKLVVFGPGHPYRGGIATTTTALVQAMRDRGHDLQFLTPRRQYPAWLYPGGNGGHDAQACPKLDGTKAVLDPLGPVEWPTGRRTARAAGADGWIVPYWTWAWAPWWRFLLAGRRPPAICVVHNPVDHDAGPIQRFAARAVLSRCQGLFTHAGVLQDHLKREYPVLPMASHPLPATTISEFPDPAEARRELGLPASCRVAAFVGLIRPYKGVDVLLDAVAALPSESDWVVLVTGEAWGGLGDRLEERASRPDLADRVRLELGWLAEERMGMVFAASDLVVLPYRAGSQSAMAPLALAHGTPVLTTEVGGLSEVVHQGINGVVVPPGSAEALTDALVGLSSERLETLAAGARRASTDLTWRGYAEALEGLIQEVVTG